MLVARAMGACRCHDSEIRQEFASLLEAQAGDAQSAQGGQTAVRRQPINPFRWHRGWPEEYHFPLEVELANQQRRVFRVYRDLTAYLRSRQTGLVGWRRVNPMTV